MKVILPYGVDSYPKKSHTGIVLAIYLENQVLDRIAWIMVLLYSGF
jgi:hypothetical protein